MPPSLTLARKLAARLPPIGRPGNASALSSAGDPSSLSAWLAGRSPDVRRRWKLPRPANDRETSRRGETALILLIIVIYLVGVVNGGLAWAELLRT